MIFPYLFNFNYLLYMLPAILFTLLVQFYVKSAYRKWSQVPARSRLTGADAAQRLIRSSGLYNVQVKGIGGQLTDRYDPSQKVLYLSQDVANGQSVASVAVAAHELGHAMQDQEGYFPLRLRAALVPAVNIGSTLGWIFIIVGLLINFTGLAWLGVLFFGLGAIFALATLPVELNASARARQMLTTSGIIVGEDEARGVSNVLNAAALTYVAALATAILQLLYYVSLVSGMGGRRRD
jgi:Zn-dependent membrane protease YugP